MKTIEKKSITSTYAKELIARAEFKAVETKINIAICIVDESGIMKAFQRMDHAPLIAIDAARKKAVTAVGFGVATGDDWYNFIKDDPILMNGAKNLKDFMLLGGGLPIIEDGQLIGAIGISGAHYKQDQVCAEYALNEK